MSFEVVVLGRVSLDLFALDRGRPLPEVERFSRHLGGSSANIAVGLARLGHTVALVSAVGDDLIADYLLGFLEQEGVATRFVRRVAGHRTSLALGEICPPHGFRQVFYRERPADLETRLEPEAAAAVARARLFVTNGTSLAAAPSSDASRAALRAAHSASVRTAFDVDYRASSWSGPDEAGRAARAVLADVDLVIGNEQELAVLTGSSEPAAQIRAVHAAGAAVVVRKLGDAGVEAYEAGGAYRETPLPVTVASTIGAGDGFAAGFLHAQLEGRPLAESLRWGNASAALVVSRVSCSDVMPRREEVEALLARSA